MSTNAIHIDGGILEGGGQLVRNVVSLSAIYSKPVFITNIRKNRQQGGLKAQHVAGLELIRQMCAATAEGIEQSSTVLTFIPKQRTRCGQYSVDSGTAGSTALLLQISLPCLLFSLPSENDSEEKISYLTLRGGTNASAAPQIDYTQHVFLPFLRSHFGINVTLDVRRRGYWPKGGGEVLATISGVSHTISPLNLTTRGAITSIRGKAFVAGILPIRIAKNMTQAAISTLVASGIDEKIIEIEVFKDNNAVGNGSGIVLWAHTTGGCYIGGSAVGVKGTSATCTGRQAGEELAQNISHGACVDEYLQDQIIIFMALAKGTSKVAIGPMTMHTKTAIHSVEIFTGASFQLEQEEGTKQSILICNGVGFFVNDRAQ